MTAPTAGWHVDPHDGSQERYWDGNAWTDHRRPAAAPLATGYPSSPESSSRAVTSLVLGILSLLLCGLVTGIPAMVVGRRATREIDASGGRLGGRGLATAGFVTGLIGTVITTILFGLVLAVFALGGAVQDSFEETCSTIVSPEDYDLYPECAP